jgi:hypothetical protein
MNYKVTNINCQYASGFDTDMDVPPLNEVQDGYLLGVGLTIDPSREVSLIMVASCGGPLLRREVTPDELASGGIRLLVNLVGTKPKDQIVVDLINDKGREGRIIFSISREPLIASAHDTLSPILVNGIFRSGTSHLMRLLSKSPDVVCHDVYPYEYRFGYYWIHLFKILSSGYNLPFDNWYFQTRTDAITPFPYVPFLPNLDVWYQVEHVAGLLTYVKDSITSVYRSLSSTACSHFLEKFPGAYHGIFKELFPTTKEIVLLRDFRDIYVSVKLFNEKRGYIAFGQESCNSDEEYLDHLGKMFTVMFRRAASEAESVFLVRYEDLILDEQKVLTRICHWAGINVPEIPKNNDAQMDYHMTSNSKMSSIGKWRGRSDEEMICKVASNYADILQDAGYEI